MKSITLHTDPDTSITSLIATGRVTASDFMGALDAFYSGTPTMLVLCDLSQADFAVLSNQELRQIVEFTESRASSRRGGRTAIVAVGDLEYGMARMYGILAEIRKHPVAIRAFRSHDDALMWLRGEP